MRYVAAALLSALGGGAITEASLKHVLDSVGIEYDAEKAKKVILHNCLYIFKNYYVSMMSNI